MLIFSRAARGAARMAFVCALAAVGCEPKDLETAPEDVPAEPAHELAPIARGGKGDARGVAYRARSGPDGRPVWLLRDTDLPETDAAPWDAGAAVRRFLVASADALGLAPGAADLRTRHVRAAAGLVVVELEQELAGRPVLGARVRVVLDGHGSVLAVHNGYIPGARVAAPDAPLVDRAAAVLAAGAAADDPEVEAELGWTLDPAGAAHAAWRVASPAGAAIVDAETREVLAREDAVLDVTGHGDVYAENAFATPETVSRPLEGLVEGGTLEGEHVDVRVGRGRRVNRMAESYNFDFRPSDRRFAEVMAYHHLDGAIRRLGRMGVYRRDEPLVVTVRAMESLNAYYDTQRDQIGLGVTRRFNVANDSDVLLHELGHAVLHAAAPGLLRGPYGTLDGALHEGFADFLSCALHDNPLSAESFTLALAESGVAPRYLEKIGFDPRTPGRRCDSGRRWPQARDLDAHVTGMIVSSILWSLREDLDRSGAVRAIDARTLRLAVRAVALARPGMTDLRDLREAMLAAERASGGRVVAAIERAFDGHGVGPRAPEDPEERPPGIPPFLR